MNSPSLSRGILVFVVLGLPYRHNGEWPINEPLSVMAIGRK